MNYKPLLIVLGEPYSTFSEILFKFYKLKKIKSKIPIILIGSKKIFIKQMHKLKYSFNVKEIKSNNLYLNKFNKKQINLINVNFNFNRTFDKITYKSSSYIKDSFKIALNILKQKKAIGMINGPVSKTHLFKKNFLGVTEFLAKKTNNKNNSVMLIYNDKLSVSPITTHLPLKKVVKSITKTKIVNNVLKINEFYNSKLKKKPNIAILGLNPHCETVDKFSEENNIIRPAIKHLKIKKIKVSGPYSADTFFMKKNIEKYDVVVGMYHDQVLTPLKTLYNFNAINITLGLPFIRISPDHGTNNKMLGQNISDSTSLLLAIKFFQKLYDNKT